MSREVLSPPIQRMSNNRNYRVNLVHEDFGGNRQQGYTEPDLYAEDDDEGEDDDINLCEIEELSNSMFGIVMQIPQAFYGGIIGFKGSTKKRIETEAQVDIYVPRNRIGERPEGITVKGKTRSSVSIAQRKINSLIDSLRKRLRPTHFVCIPLNYGDIKTNYLQLKKEIIDANLPGIDEELFQSEECIHLTICVSALMDDAERAKAVKILEECRSFLADMKTPFDVKASGLEIMNDDPSSVRVLYASIDSPAIQQFGDRVSRHFIKRGLSYNEHGRDGAVKLHMTIMNVKYRKKLNSQAANTFDAREILKRFGDYTFGSLQCNEMQLCALRTNESKEYYKITGSIKF